MEVTPTLRLLFSDCGSVPALALPLAELCWSSPVLLEPFDHQLSNDRNGRRLLGKESLKRPFMKKGPYVGRHAAMMEQLGSIWDQMKASVTRAA